MNLRTVLIVLLILMLVGALPNWGYHHYGWYPAGGLGTVLLILILVALFG